MANATLKRERETINRLIRSLSDVPALSPALPLSSPPHIEAIDECRFALHLPCPDRQSADVLAAHDWGWLFLPFRGHCSTLTIDAPDGSVEVQPQDPRNALLETAGRQVLGLHEGAFKVDIEPQPWECMTTEGWQPRPDDADDGYPFVGVYVDTLLSLEQCCQQRHVLKQLASLLVPNYCDIGIAYYPEPHSPLNWKYPVLSIPAEGEVRLIEDDPRLLALGLLIEAGLALEVKRDPINPGFVGLDVTLTDGVLTVSGTVAACRSVEAVVPRAMALLQPLQYLPDLGALDWLVLQPDGGPMQTVELRP